MKSGVDAMPLFLLDDLLSVTSSKNWLLDQGFWRHELFISDKDRVMLRNPCYFF